jgi:cytoskeleton protein RodZ
MARPDCPRCGSDLIVAAPSGAPSDLVMQLRGENVPAIATGAGPVHWLCRSCGHRWDPPAQPDAWPSGPGDGSDPAEVSADLEVASHPSRDTATTAETRTGPGSALRRARQEARKTLAEVSSGTGVWEPHLLALESDAPLEEFPAHSYARLYLREYAEFLHLDPEPLLRDLDALHPVIEEPAFEPFPDARGRRKLVALVLAVLSVAAITLIVLRPSGSPPRAMSPLPSDDAPVVVDGAGDAPSPTGATREPSGVRATLTLSQPSWVEAVSDGEVVAAATLQPGKPVTYRARKSFQLTLGNAGGVRLRINGERVATGTPGEVVSFDFRWRDGAVSTART